MSSKRHPVNKGLRRGKMYTGSRLLLKCVPRPKLNSILGPRGTIEQQTGPRIQVPAAKQDVYRVSVPAQPPRATTHPNQPPYELIHISQSNRQIGRRKGPTHFWSEAEPMSTQSAIPLLKMLGEGPVESCSLPFAGLRCKPSWRRMAVVITAMLKRLLICLTFGWRQKCVVNELKTFTV